MEKVTTKYRDQSGNVFVQRFAVRHPLIEEVKASPAGCLLRDGKIYICYNHLYKPEMLGLVNVSTEEGF